MAKDTKERIMRSAEHLFSLRQFDDVSIAEICREANVSNGVYYRYFRNKEILLRSLNDSFLEYFEEMLSRLDGESVEERLHDFISIVLRVGRERKSEITIFREGQYRFYGYEDKLREIYIKSAEKVFGREISEAEYLYTLSGLRFCSTRALYNGMKVKPEYLVDFILKGILHSGKKTIPRLPDTFKSPFQPSAETGQAKLIQSGLSLFGEKGFYHTAVADIVRDSGLAVGTFYTHFESKEMFLNHLVLKLGENTRHYLSEQVAAVEDRLEQEISGLWYFLNYFHDHLEYYSIVREAEFVANEVVNQYYNAFEQGYMKNLTSVPEGEKRLHGANFLMGLAHYTGIEVLHRKRIQDIKPFLQRIMTLLDEGISC
ncbi:TetR/AcrR family transcriptional regulator [Spirochaeta isovalerica]|uniref:AcrR family transcriptional regulator n=1 Tax=Spirochaeta isovalerica TaxID=150 RepID=A0A841RAW8_9SPIO|nr:TetR/AcrR family transcriptional regulator [Spirochaeta isovalerica]MBB6482534.1 AcrR family transcriptional regulator [Spirochaeta isovalerica]